MGWNFSRYCRISRLVVTCSKVAIELSILKESRGSYIVCHRPLSKRYVKPTKVKTEVNDGRDQVLTSESLVKICALKCFSSMISVHK